MQVAAESNARHVDTVLRTLAQRDGAHETFVAVFDVGIHHVEVALADRDVDWLTYRAARVMNVRRHVRELYEILKISDRCITTAVVEIVNKR